MVLQLLLQIDLIYQIAQTVNLYLLNLVSILSDLRIFGHILQLKLSLNVELECLDQVLVRVLGLFSGLCLLFLVLFLQKSVFVLA